MSEDGKKRYVVVGTGGRAEMFIKALTSADQDVGALVAMCDRNPGRLELWRSRVPDACQSLPLYGEDDFDRMIAEARPDTVIVTTMDRFHDKYIVRALELGCDAITEKPMTIDAPRCRRIVDTVRRTGRTVRVTFNYRYAPPRTQVKELLLAGTIGQVLSVDFHWLLDTSHGADYFRRWHRRKENSGGLMVHKATHHFDLVNWWLGTVPEEVHAHGKRAFYTPETARRLGLDDRAERCHGCPAAEKCRFRLDMASNKSMRELYLDQEHHDGYQRDRCVFSDQIDIEDTMNLNVRYRNGVLMSYSLNAFSPWEGYVITFNGTEGRLEHRTTETTYISGDGRVPGETVADASYIRVYPAFETMYEVPLRTGAGGHGGGDRLLLNDVFRPGATPDPLRRAADHRAGAYSILTGVAANESMATGRPVRIEDLVPGVSEPDYP